VRLLAAAAAAAAFVHGGAAPPVSFETRATTLVLSGQTYRLVLSRRNGKIVDLVDRASGTRLVRDANRCLWGTLGQSDLTYHGGCSFAGRTFSYRWNRRTQTLTLTYRSAARVTLHALPAYVDLRLHVTNAPRILTRVQFPSVVVGDTRTVSAGYVPSVLPGLRLAPQSFAHIANAVQIYPSRWAFADWLALDVRRAHLSLYTVNRGPIAPVQLGFLRKAGSSPCSGTAFCVVHQFETWIPRGSSWTSPLVRVRVGADARQSALAYRKDNGIDAYPSLREKLGAQLDTLARAPLVKANLALLPPFRDWAARLDDLPVPSLLHPVGFNEGGHDVNDPDFLPPSAAAGTTGEFAAAVEAAHAHGDLVMPYTNLSWWDPTGPTFARTRATDVGVLDPQGEPETVMYGPHSGVIVSAFAPFVRRRVAEFFDEWRTRVPADCIFLDQLGARPWLRDFNPASPTVLAYDDGWLDLLHAYRDRCVMVEDGWDRLARDAVGFHGSALMMSRELGLVDTLYGKGDWQPYPIADWLFHDKVLMYQHDLFDGTMARDDEVLTWNMAFGLVSSWSWDAGTGDRLHYDGALQRAVGPHYAGVPLDRFRDLAPGVTESTFGDLVVVANFGTSPYESGGYEIAPKGFLARAPGVLAAVLADGRHHLVTS
jgi:hypothetical protein